MDDVYGYFTILHNQELCDLHSLLRFVMNSEIPGSHDGLGMSLGWVAKEFIHNAVKRSLPFKKFNCIFSLPYYMYMLYILSKSRLQLICDFTRLLSRV
jgi:hypothetical protein